MLPYTTVLYHANCPDGWAAAHYLMTDIELKADYIPMAYGDNIYQKFASDCFENKHVLMVDFSLTPFQIEELRDHTKFKSLTIIDHHSSAQRHLEGYTKYEDYLDIEEFLSTDPKMPVLVHFDMNYSGVGLVHKLITEYFKYYYWDTEEPELHPLYQYVQDRDIWKFALPSSVEVNSAIGSYPLDQENWDYLRKEFDLNGIWKLAYAGASLDRKYMKQVTEITRSFSFIKINDVLMPFINANYTFVGGISRLLLEEYDCIAVYSDNSYNRRVSLRSNQEAEVPIDVSVLAEKFGGGGHPGAAGFYVDFDWRGE